MKQSMPVMIKLPNSTSSRLSCLFNTYVFFLVLTFTRNNIFGAMDNASIEPRDKNLSKRIYDNAKFNDKDSNDISIKFGSDKECLKEA